MLVAWCRGHGALFSVPSNYFITYPAYAWVFFTTPLEYPSNMYQGYPALCQQPYQVPGHSHTAAFFTLHHICWMP